MKLFAGPCALESGEVCFEVAKTISKYIPKHVDFYFKTSFEKANRSSHNSFTGKGYGYAMDVFSELRKSGYKIITDVHLPNQVDLFHDYVDAFQVPAFLCRQSELLEVVAKSGKLVNVKKGQFISPRNAILLGEKMESYGCEDFYICERGSCFGYDNLVVDFRTIDILKNAGFKVCFDATHSTQEGGDSVTSGNWKYAEKLSKSALVWGTDALFVEVHPKPSEALSDKDCQIPLSEFPNYLSSVF